MSFFQKLKQMLSSNPISPLPDQETRQRVEEARKNKQGFLERFKPQSTWEFSAEPQPTRAPQQMNPMVKKEEPFIFDSRPYYAGKGTGMITQPPKPIAEILRQQFPNDATRSAIAVANESGYNPNAQGKNTNGSLDRGLFQINSNTFADFQRRKPQVLAALGIRSYDDMFDPIKNAQMAKIIQAEQGWGAWYGPVNQGYNIK